jgi:hypothetical protein
MTPGTDLVLYDSACAALSKARNVDEVKDIHDKAEAMRVYARQAKNRDLEIDAAEIRMRAERRLGELLAAQKALPREQGGGMNKGASAGGKKESPRGAFTEPRDQTPTLAELGIDKKLSSRSQKFAAVPEPKFEKQLSEWRERAEKGAERVTSDVAKLAAPKPPAETTPRERLEQELRAMENRLDKLWEDHPRNRDLIVSTIGAHMQMFRSKLKSGQKQ